MKSLRLSWVFLMVLPGATQSVWGQQRPVLKSPEVLADHRVAFRLWAPSANEIQLSGDWMGPKPPVALSKDANGVWTVIAGPFEPNIYTYSFLVDGVSASDPSCRCTLAWAGRTGLSTFTIAGSTPEPWEEQGAPHGTLHYETYLSGARDALRPYVVYTPPGYSQSSSRRYPVLILLPGTPGDENDWTTGGGFAQIVFDNLIAEKKMPPTIVVMHASDVLKNGKRADKLKEVEPLIVGGLVRAVKSRYRVERAPAFWGIAGLSLGGEFAMAIGLRHLELFRTVASLSGSMVERDFEDHFGKALARPEQINKQYRLIWLGCGSEDIFLGGNRALAAKFTSAGIRSRFVEFSGFHVMPVFRRQLIALLPNLFR